MTDREKLVELLTDCDCPYPCKSADYLIENGVAPVVHGRWETVHDGWGRCSNCHRMDEIHKLATHYRFCGARMDGDGNA